MLAFSGLPAFAGQLLFNLLVITLAQGFLRSRYYNILLLDKTTISMLKRIKLSNQNV